MPHTSTLLDLVVREAPGCTFAGCALEHADGAGRELGGQPDTDSRPPDRLLWAVNTFGEARAPATHSLAP